MKVVISKNKILKVLKINFLIGTMIYLIKVGSYFK